MSETEWIIGMSVFLRGTLEEQIAYAYEVYDFNGDRSIAREEISQLLRNCINPIPGVGIAAIDPEVNIDIDELNVTLGFKKNPLIYF